MTYAYAPGPDLRFIENCFTVSAQALCFYNFCLTFTREVQFMWKLKPSVGSVLFFTLRYTAPCNIFPVILGYLSHGVWQSQLSCTVMARLQMTGDVLVLTSGAIFAALRIYALSRKNKWNFGVTLLLGLINPVLTTTYVCGPTVYRQYTFVLTTPYLAHLAPGHQNCNADSQLMVDICGSRQRFKSIYIDGIPRCAGMMAGRGSAVVCDAVALVLTWLGIKHLLQYTLEPERHVHLDRNANFENCQGGSHISHTIATMIFRRFKFPPGMEGRVDQELEDLPETEENEHGDEMLQMA
ncbi:uncharacterized protein C8Q71DRAFT_724192 [Rhodofomes roseus]|uniref:DUF6533 domain-containing protein n=1 Tax=Rhodofomes roseus TaxID=34475 RepID=A0ABQ8KFA7_9APHY|nr:uncharacterized protein C8Q71DRAFT_724192 [Rhodofomes roseus]KAH9836410.1 hypothetical protein C8Q71DRAFT_724192 [Rhodofomes roseus]